MSLRPYTRGTSILAALVFVAILGGVALGVSALSPSQHFASLSPKSQVAETGTATDRGIQDLRNNVPTTCDTKRKSAAASQSQNSKSTATSASEVDDCVAAVYKPSNGHTKKDDYLSYQCVGKSATITIDAKGAETINSYPATDGTLPGVCKATACGPSSNGKSECIQANMAGIDKSKVQSYLNGSVPNSDRGYQQFSMNDNQIKTLMSAQSTDQINQAFQDSYQSAHEDLTASQFKVQDLEKQLAALQTCSGELCDSSQQQAIQQQIQNEQAKQAQLQSQMNGLAQAQEQMKTNPPPVPQGEPQSTPDNKPPSGPDTFPKVPQPDPRKQMPGPVPNPGPGSNPGPSNPGGGFGGGLEGMLGSLLKGLSQGLAKSAAQANAPACPSDPNAYSQAQQQYNMQLQQYNLQLQQYNMQSQYAQMNGYPPPPPPQPPVACQPNGSSNTCVAQPPQPTSACQGTWTPIRTQQSNGASCTTGWQCVPTSATPPTAQISCQPLVADVGMSIAISYTCGNADGSAGLGFDTANAISGSTSTVIMTPPQGTNTATFGVQCRNQGLTANAQCSIQVGRASIVLVATPRTIAPHASSTIGWVTSGMQSCVISSPTLSDFTLQNATNTSVSGAAISPPLATTTDFVLGCTTVGGSARQATTTVVVSATSTSN